MRTALLCSALLLAGCRGEAKGQAAQTNANALANTNANTNTNASANANANASANANANANANASANTNASANANANTNAPENRKGAIVVHIGDSFTHAHFQQNLQPRFNALGVKYRVYARTSTYTTTWANPGEIGPHLWSKPALVLITLGANEWEMPRPADHQRAVEEIVRQVSKVSPCVWISPPSWKPSTGIKEIIRDHAAPCLFFDSDVHVPDIERQNDRIHPNEAGGAKWAAKFWEWLEAHRDPAKGPYALRPDPPSP